MAKGCILHSNHEGIRLGGTHRLQPHPISGLESLIARGILALIASNGSSLVEGRTEAREAHANGVQEYQVLLIPRYTPMQSRNWRKKPFARRAEDWHSSTADDR